MKEAAANHKASIRDLVYLIDRILIRQEKKQLFGT